MLLYFENKDNRECSNCSINKFICRFLVTQDLLKNLYCMSLYKVYLRIRQVSLYHTHKLIRFIITRPYQAQIQNLMLWGGCSREMGVKGSFLTKKNNVILPISYIFFYFWGVGGCLNLGLLMLSESQCYRVIAGNLEWKHTKLWPCHMISIEYSEVFQSEPITLTSIHCEKSPTWVINNWIFLGVMHTMQYITCQCFRHHLFVEIIKSSLN